MSHEKLYCGNCHTDFEVAWKIIGKDDMEDIFDHPMVGKLHHILTTLE